MTIVAIVQTATTGYAGRTAGNYIRFRVDTEAELPSADVIDGDSGFTVDTGHVYLRVTGSWVDTGSAPASWGSITGEVSSQVDISTLYATTSHVHSASNITSSTLAVARIAAGTANISTFADGTGNWSVPVYGNISSLPTLGTAASTAASDYASSTHNISSATHTFPGGTTNFLRADGTFAAPPAGSSNISTIKTTSLVFTTTTSSLPLTNFGFTVSNTVNYSFEFGLVYASAISSTGLRVGLQYPSASTFAANVEIPAVVATGTDSRTQGYIIASGSSVVAPSTPLSSTQYIAFVWGQILPSANGTLQFCYATEVAGVAISSFAGSYGILTTY